MSNVPRFSDRNRRSQVSDLAGVICALTDPTVRLEEVAAPAILAATHEGNERRAYSGPWNAGASVPLGMALARDLTATGGASSGGALLGSDRIDLQTTLRPFSAVLDAGVRAVTVPGGSGDPVGVPSVTTPPVAAWMETETSEAPESNAVFGLASPVPKRLSFSFFVSWRLLKMGGALLQAALDAEVFNAIGRAVDAAVLGGTGADGQPQGIVGAAGINTTTGASLAHAGLLEMRKEALLGGAREDDLIWIATPAVQELLGGRERASGSATYLWEDRMVLGLPATATTAAPAGTLIVGDFARCAVYLFGDLDVIVDRRFLSTGGKVRVVVHLFADVALGHPAAFSVASSVS